MMIENEMPQSQWLQTELGLALMRQEQAVFDEIVANLFGFYAVQLGMLQMNVLQQSRMPHLVHLGNKAGRVLCESDYLPLAESSIDLICLPHVLEFSPNPHQTLREAERVLVPEGHLILTGFNPVSSWGLYKACAKNAAYPWSGHFFSMPRIKDWLALLGLEFVQGKMLCHHMPVNNAKWLNRLDFLARCGEKSWPALGGVYFIVAKKRVVNMHLLKPNWKKSPLKSGLAVGHKKTKPMQKQATQPRD